MTNSSVWSILTFVIFTSTMRHLEDISLNKDLTGQREPSFTVQNFPLFTWGSKSFRWLVCGLLDYGHSVHLGLHSKVFNIILKDCLERWLRSSKALAALAAAPSVHMVAPQPYETLVPGGGTAALFCHPTYCTEIRTQTVIYIKKTHPLKKMTQFFPIYYTGQGREDWANYKRNPSLRNWGV